MSVKNFIKDRRSILYIIAFSIIIFACLWAFISASVITNSFKNKIANQTYQNKEANIESLLVTETKDGDKLWELFADAGTYTDMNNIVLLEGIIGNFYGDKMVKASFKADRGTYNTDKKEIILYGDVMLVYKDGTNISAERITYKGKNTDITAVGNVRIEKPGEAVLIGNKAILDGNYKDFHIEGRTQTRFYM